MNDNALHAHPKNPEGVMYGRLREHKEELEAGDVYNHPNGTWVQIPDVFVGCCVPRNSTTIYIHPAKTTPTFVTPDVLDSSEGWT